MRQAILSAGASLALQWFVWTTPGIGQTGVPAWTFDGGQIGAHLGFSVASAGDVNGDGFHDVLVGAPDASESQPGEGIARLFLGSASGLSPTPAWSVAGGQPGARFASCVASAGDVNGDGFHDVLVGAPAFDGEREDQGAVFLYLGSADGLSLVAVRVWQGSQAGQQFGSSVSSAGDVNRDGFDDVLIGSPGFDDAHENEGAAHLFLGTSSEMTNVSAWLSVGGQEGAAFGSSVAAVGDVNGDGFADVAIGAPFFDGGQTDEGQVRMFAGDPLGLGTSPLQTFEHNVDGSQFGFSVAGGGNLSGDGQMRLLFGAPKYRYTHIEEGGTFLGAFTTGVFFLDFGRQDFAHRGASIASAGDVNGDGLTDVIIGADRYDNGETDEGLVTVHLGHPSFVVDRTPFWALDVDQSLCAFGFSVASAGDVNGDGFDDVVAGAPDHDHDHADEGRAFVFLGRSALVVNGDELAALGRPMIRLAGSNPFRGQVSARFTIPLAGRVQLSVFDIRGRRRALLVDEVKESGTHAATWDGLDESSGSSSPGVYFFRLEFDRDSAVCKVVRIE